TSRGGLGPHSRGGSGIIDRAVARTSQVKADIEIRDNAAVVRHIKVFPVVLGTCARISKMAGPTACLTPCYIISAGTIPINGGLATAVVPGAKASSTAIGGVGLRRHCG